MKKQLRTIALLLVSATTLVYPLDAGGGFAPPPDDYSALHLSEMGLTREVYTLAIKGLRKLDAEKKLTNLNVITIVDYSQSSNQKRLYVIDLKNKKILFHSYVAHGRKTGEEFARTFSNSDCSYQSSLGFYVSVHIRDLP